jgi:hypothetical protein
MRKLFAVVQIDQIKAWCWGMCGKGIAASIHLDDSFEAMPCAQPGEACPYLDRDDTEAAGIGNFPSMGDDGEYEIWLRKLKPLDEPE